jgi:hypothetical protein
VSFLEHTGKRMKMQISSNSFKKNFGTRVENIMEKLVRIFISQNITNKSYFKLPPLIPPSRNNKAK